MVIDADISARQRLLEALLQVDHRLNIQPCESANSAQRLLLDAEFDLWFLDVDLPGVSGFGFLDCQLDQQRLIPPIVFTTAHKDFALRAFDYPVLDYLLKPLSCARVAKTMDKLSGLRNSLRSEPKVNQESQQSSETTLVRFKNGTNALCLRRADILWIEAAGDYMCVHTLTDTHILRSTMLQLERQLCQQRFVRVSRSALVNWEKVKGFKSATNGRYKVELIDQVQLNVSRKYKMLIPEMNQA